MAAHDPLAGAMDELRAFKALADAGATWAEIARETGYDWRTVKRYLSAEAPAAPPAPAKRGSGPRKTDPYTGLIDAWLRKQPKLKASVIHERLVAEHGFTGHYQRVKVYVREHRARLTEAEPEPAGFHRRFEVLPGAQAQVDWGDEGEIQTATGPLRVSSFHLTLAYSRDPFCCFTAAQDLGTFWDCHRRAFAHFGGVPGVIVYDRTKTVVRRHVGRGQQTPLHSEAVAFASHYDFAIWLAAPYRARPRGGLNARLRSSAAMCWLAAGSSRCTSWTPRLPPGCRSAARRSTAPTGRSSGCGPNATGPRCARCPSSPTWSVTGTPAGSARTP
jgi:transposase